MQPQIHTEHLEGRLVAVGPGLVDVALGANGAGAEALVAQLAFATEHRFRVEVRGAGPLVTGTCGRIEAEFVVGHDGTVADHEVVLFIHTEEGGPQR